MPRERSPQRQRAFELWRGSDGKMKLKDIAIELSVSDTQVRKWKNQDQWERELKGNVTEQKSNVTKRRAGAPPGNQNASGNSGGTGGPVGNAKAVTHGFFRRIFPDDDDTRAILGAIETMDPLDILWQNIVIQYTAIARAQRLMFVDDQDDHTQVLKRRKDGDNSEEREWEYQFSWDKHATFLQAQSRAISTLEGLIARYEEMLPKSLRREEQRLRITKLKAEVTRLQNPDGEGDVEDDGFIEALKGRGSEVWRDDVGDET